MKKMKYLMTPLMILAVAVMAFATVPFLKNNGRTTVYAANAFTDSVTVGGAVLNSTTPYRLSASGTASATGTLGGNASAYFNAATGTLNLHNYVFTTTYTSSILVSGSAGDNRDIIINLTGTNTITSTSAENIVHNPTGGNITITSTAVATLGITSTSENTGHKYGISTVADGNVIINGYADVNISLTISGNYYSMFGVSTANGDIDISGNANFAVSFLRSSYVYSYGLSSGGAIFINTKGNVTLDAITPFRTNSLYLVKGKLTLKWINTPTKLPYYNPAYYTVDTSVSSTAVYTYQSTPKITIAAISGVRIPKAGETPATTVTATDEFTGTITWLPVHEKFEPDVSYTAKITLTPKGSFTVTGVAANFFTVAGATSVTNSKDSGIITAVFPAEKQTGQTVAAPTLNTVTDTAITINEVDAPTGQTVEYGITTTNSVASIEEWQDEISFAGLTKATQYYIFARAKENGGYTTGAPTSALSVNTKDSGAAVTPPSNYKAGKKTDKSITVNAIAASQNGQTVEYAISKTNSATGLIWQDGTTFENLDAKTTYYIFARSKGNQTNVAGAAAMVLEVKTDKAPTSSDVLGIGAVVGIIVGEAVLVCGIGFALYWFLLRKQKTA